MISRLESCNIAILRHYRLHPKPLLRQWCLPIKAGPYRVLRLYSSAV